MEIREKFIDLHWLRFSPDGVGEPLFSYNDYDFFMLDRVTLTQFKEFIDSLHEEKDTWSLDMQIVRTVEDYYATNVNPQGTLIAMKGDEMAALFTSAVNVEFNLQKNKRQVYLELTGQTIVVPDYINNILERSYSYVVKKEYQRQGLATQGLKFFIEFKILQSREFLYRVELGSNGVSESMHKVDVDAVINVARTHTHNLGSRYLLKNLGFQAIDKTLSSAGTEQITYAWCVTKDDHMFFLDSDDETQKNYDDDIDKLKMRK